MGGPRPTTRTSCANRRVHGGSPFDRAYWTTKACPARDLRHIAGWYAQKHPDEDFAETFAVWLTPRLNWRRRYQEWAALAKLEYVDRTAKALGEKDPLRSVGKAELPVDEMQATIEDFYRERTPDETPAVADLPLDVDLDDLLTPAPQGSRPAAGVPR
jgi:hypothetical protein